MSFVHRHLAKAVVLAALLGWLLGSSLPDVPGLVASMSFLKTAFLSALKMIIAPLIFFSLLSGILRLNEAMGMRRLGAVTVAYYLFTSAIAIAIGLTVVLLVHPWTDFPPLQTADNALRQGVVLINQSGGGLLTIFTGLIEKMLVNPFTALAELNILGIVTNGIVIGLAALVVLPRDSALPELIHQITEVTYRLAHWAITLMPIGVLAIVFQLADNLTTDLLQGLLAFMLVVFSATAIHGLIVLPLIAWIGVGENPFVLWRKIARPIVVALTTSSSAATLPLSMATATKELKVSPAVASFVLPLGATVNMDGTALFEGVAAVFLAYLFGIELSTTAMITVFLVAMLSSMGAPGIPSGSMAGMQVVLLAVGIPLEAIGILLLVERPLDTFRTAVNVEGDLIGTLFAHKYGRGSDVSKAG